ncbi:MAG: sigma-E factor negative regulatory protein [Pseudoxanthomonas sp.]
MTIDKLDTHYFKQLSALMDGDLPPDQARFLLRRLEHDSDLTGCWDRWQLCGEVLRGHAQAPAPAGFADRIAALIAVESVAPAANAASAPGRGLLVKWGGGALAASVAAIALFMVRQQVPDEAPAPSAPTVAGQSPDNSRSVASPASGLQAAAAVTAASVAVASVPLRTVETQRRSATRNQQAARQAAAARRQPDRAIASVAVPATQVIASSPVGGNDHNPFAHVQASPPASRPWPRTVLPQYSSGSGAFNADYSTDGAAQTFYPFEPRLPATPPVTVPEASRER